MRPVDRGTIPLDALDNPKVFTEYADARADLFDRIGRYCSFCERPILSGLAIEHVLPKSLPQFKRLECEWSNFLLGCMNCNSTKGSRPSGRKQMLLPDQDNTFRAIAYSVGGRVSPSPTLSLGLKRKAKLLIRVVGLDRLPTNDPQAKDLRWNDRREAWDKATRYRAKYVNGGIAVETIVELCKNGGHWSIWMTVFDGIKEVRLALIEAFSGTLQAKCFDANGESIARPGGQL
jgi:uncharacterized protein (TIGR02646 family)